MTNCFGTSQKESYRICDVIITVALQKHYLSTHRNSPRKRTRNKLFGCLTNTSLAISLRTAGFILGFNKNQGTVNQNNLLSLFLCTLHIQA